MMAWWSVRIAVFYIVCLLTVMSTAATTGRTKITPDCRPEWKSCVPDAHDSSIAEASPVECSYTPEQRVQTPPPAEEETVESAFIPGLLVPPEVERSLEALLSRETVRRMDAHDARGHDMGDGDFNGQYIPSDMKDVIRSFVNKYYPESEQDAAPLFHQFQSVYDRGTEVASPCTDLKKPRTSEYDCRPKHSASTTTSTPYTTLMKKKMKEMGDAVLKKEVIVAGVVLLLMTLVVSALLFVYGVSDTCAAVVSAWTALRCAFEKCQTTVHEEPLEEKQERSLVSEKAQARQTGKHNARHKANSSLGNGKSSSRKRSKVHAAQRPKNDATDTVGKREANKLKKAPAKAQHETKEQRDESDENNDWQEVINNKPKGRTIRTKHLPEDESLSPIKVTPKLPVSEPNTPESTQENRQNQPTDEQDSGKMNINPIKTYSSSPISRKDPSAMRMDPNPGLQLPMTTSRGFSDERTSYSNGFDLSPLQPYGELKVVQHSPVRQSPFAASMDLPFSSGSPVAAGRYPGAQQPTERQFQSKIDCLLRNLRNKPFSVHPVGRFQQQQPPLRRAVTDLEEMMMTHRPAAVHLQHSLSGSLDPSLSSSGMLNNRLFPFPSPPLTDDPYMPRQMSGGLLPMHPSRMARQRAGSLPLTQPQAQSFFPSQSQSVMTNSMNNAQYLSNNCSLFSSNPSIWSVDLSVDRDFVKPSLPKNANFPPAPSAAPDGQYLDIKRCLPEQLLSEVSSFPDH